jgi:hypothetical protein
MPEPVITVFVSYSHKDAAYLEDDSLLGYLKGFEQDNVAFWTDRNIRTGEIWDEVIKANIQEAHIALVLVSQSFLDSEYCQNVEIKHFLAQKSHLFPIILSACEWRRHEWLRSRQFLPGGDQTVEEHYTDPGRRKRLFLEVRQQLRERVELIRREPGGPSRPPDSAATSGPVSATAATPPRQPSYSGKTTLKLLRRLGESWRDLATYVGIPAYDQARFERGDEGRQIWVWLENRRQLHELPQALAGIGRHDLVELLAQEQ